MKTCKWNKFRHNKTKMSIFQKGNCLVCGKFSFTIWGVVMHVFLLKKTSIQIGLVLLLVAIMLSLQLSGGSLATVYFGYAPRKVPIYCVNTDQKQVAISFDSAWGADKTQSILNTLKQYEAGATFFLVGFWVEKYENMVTAIDEMGFEIGTHSNTHPDLTKLSESDMQLELEKSMELITNLTQKPVTLFRAPYGAYNNTLLTVTERMNLHTIQWDVDTLDWQGLSAIEITTRVLNLVKNGSIILCHNNADHIVEALPLILNRLQMQGYTITSVGDLILTENYYVDSQGIQRKK